MKKQLFLISLIFAMFVAYGQEVTVEEPAAAPDTAQTSEKSFCPHKIWLRGGGAFTNNVHNKAYTGACQPVIARKYGNLALLEVGYSYFFTEHWGLGLGVTLNGMFNKTVYGGQGTIDPYTDPNYIPQGGDYVAGDYTLNYKVDRLTEKQRIWAIEIPLVAQFQHKFDGRNGIFAALGVKGYFPFSAKSFFKDAEGAIQYDGYDSYLNVYWPQGMPVHFEDGNLTGSTTKAKMRCSIDLQADFGGIFAINKITDLYVGAYCSYGFLNILPKNSQDLIALSSDGKLDFSGALNSASGKWHLLQVGMKVGFHFNACANPGELESMRSLKKRYMKDMMDKANEPIVVKTTEYVYIVPVCPEETDEQTQEQKDNIKQLAEILSNTKILFDLDKDIPKIADYNDNINRTAELMKKDRSLLLVVEGYTCDLGSEEHNRDLAIRRANKIRDLFIQKGVPADQIETASYTVNDPENARNITDKSREEHRAAIFRIKTR